jgi:trigger factor
LKIETVARDDQQTRLVAELDVETMEKYKHQAARKVSQSTKIPGFRPGKAPYNLVRQMVGDERLTQEAVELLLEEVYPKILTEANISPSGPGKLEEIITMDPPTFAFIVPLPPEVVIGEYQALKKEYAPEPITDEQVEQTINRLQRSYATAEPVEHAAQKGDMVSFKLSAKRTQSEEGQSETLLDESPYQMIAGEEDELEEAFPYAGFTAELLGLSAGETKTLIHTFSDESSYEDLRGKEAEFTIVADNVKEMHLSEVNDEFAQGLGEFQTVDDLKKAIRQQLEQNYAQQYDQNYFNELIEELISMSTVRRSCWMTKWKNSCMALSIIWSATGSTWKPT